MAKLGIGVRGDAPRRTPSHSAVLAATAAIVGATFSIGAAVQTVTLQAQSHLGPSADIAQLGTRIAVNLVAVTIAVVVAYGGSFAELSPRRFTGYVAALAATAAAVRVALQWLVHAEIAATALDVVTEFFAGLAVVALSLIVGRLVSSLAARAEREVRQAALQQRRADEALRALQDEESRVRRQLADGLHGTVQQELVLVDVALRDIESVADAELAARLAELRTRLDRLRRIGVRDLSRLLSPEGLEFGLVRAIRLMVGRVPASIGVALSLDPRLAGLDDSGGLSDRVRLLAARLVEECLTNTLKHGSASRVELRVEVLGESRQLHLVFEDDGVGLPGDVELNGLAVLRARLEAAGAELRIRPEGALGGAGIEALLPLDEAAEAPREG